MLRNPVKLTKLDKYLCVFYKLYPSFDAVPTTLPAPTINKVRNKFRVHLNIGSMIIFSVTLSTAALISKQRKEGGLGVASLMDKWYKKS